MIDPVENDLYRYERMLDKAYELDRAIELRTLDLLKEYNDDISVLTEVFKEWVECATDDDLKKLYRIHSYWEILYVKAKEQAEKEFDE